MLLCSWSLVWWSLLQDLAQYTCTIIDGDIIRCTIPNLEGIRYVLEIATVQQHETDPTNTFTAVLTDISNNQDY